MIGNPTITTANPFLGVKSFGVNDSEHFYGRTEQIGEVLRKLRGSHFLAVVGTAGSGKSSMVKGGLVPQLTDPSKNKTRTRWRTTIFHPGKNPISNLASALAQRKVLHPDYKLEPNFETNMENTLRRSSQGLVEAFKNAKLEGDHLLIVVEHFEEIFQVKGNEAKDFVQLLLTAGKHVVPVYIVITLRSDFIGSCSKFRGLSEMVGQSQFTMPRMKSKELRRVVVEPIQANEASISPRLISRLLQDFDSTPEPLPLAALQHSMMRTWEKWEEDVETAKENGESINIKIGTSHYEASGGMHNSIQIHLDEIYDGLSEKDQGIAIKLFKALTESKGAEALGIRRTMTVSELAELTEVSEEKISKVVNAFRTEEQHFLVAPDERLHSDSEINLAHDVLMEAWPRLKEWMEEELESASFYKRISEAAILYKEGKAGVWSNPDLGFALKWREDNQPNKAWSLRYDDNFAIVLSFLAASKAAHEEEERLKAAAEAEKKRKARMFAIAMGIFGVVCLILAGAAGWAFYEAQKSAVVAQEKAEEAKIKSVKALLAEIDANQSAKQAEMEKKAAKVAEVKATESAEQAKIAMGKATKSAKEANAAKAVADKEKEKAKKSAEEAKAKKLIADKATKDAQKSADEAKKQKIEADKAKADAVRVKSLTLANALALKSSQLTKKNPKALLAREAYNITVKQDGDLRDPDLYAGLYGGMKAMQKDPEFNIHKKHAGSVNELIIRNNSVYTAGGDGKIMEWSVASWKDINKPSLKLAPVALTKTGRIQNSMDLNGSRSHLIVSGERGNFVIPLKGSEEPKKLNIHNSRESWVSRFINSGEFVSSGADRTIKRYNISSEEVQVLDSVASHVHAMTVFNNLLIGGDRAGNIIVWDLNKNRRLSKVRSGRGKVTSLKFSPNGSMLLSGHQDGGIQQWVMKGAEPKKIKYIGKHTSGVSDLSFSSDGKYLASSSYNGEARVWEVNSFAKTNPHFMKLFDVNSPAMSVGFANDNKQVVVGYKNGSLQFWTLSAKILADDICNKLQRNMSNKEWMQYVGEDIEYRKTCASKPKGEGVQ